jgi:hypothetical protein
VIELAFVSGCVLTMALFFIIAARVLGSVLIGWAKSRMCSGVWCSVAHLFPDLVECLLNGPMWRALAPAHADFSDPNRHTELETRFSKVLIPRDNYKHKIENFFK